MPSMAVHLAVANEFLKHNFIKDKTSFRKGVMEPDILGLVSQEQKEKAHYTEPKTPNMTQAEQFRRKVNLFNYLSDKKIDSDFEIGYYLHLATDFWFFNIFLIKKYDKILKLSPNLTEIYNDYERIAKHMEIVFGVDNSDTPWAGMYRNEEPILFTKQEICEFVEKCAKVDIFKMKDKILKSPQNWRLVAENFFE